MINVEHKQTHVIVTFTGNVTESSIIELVGAIDRLKSDYFYRRIELRIASPGGDVVALDYFIDALSNGCKSQTDPSSGPLTRKRHHVVGNRHCSPVGP